MSLLVQKYGGTSVDGPERIRAVAGRVACMLEGRIVLQSDAGEVTREQVTQAYFGLEAAA